MSVKKTKEQTFKDLTTRLEEITLRMENGDLTLEESVELFKEGVDLVQKGTRRLDEIEKEVAILMKDASGREIEVPFEDDAEED